jgi:hypothetical protein
MKFFCNSQFPLEHSWTHVRVSQFSAEQYWVMDEAGFRDIKKLIKFYQIGSRRQPQVRSCSYIPNLGKMRLQSENNPITGDLVSPVPCSCGTNGQGTTHCIQCAASYDSLESLGLVICTVGTKNLPVQRCSQSKNYGMTVTNPEIFSRQNPK